MKKSYILAGIAIFLWSTIATISKLLLGTMDSMQVLAISSLFAFLFLLILNIIKGNLNQLKQLKLTDLLIIAGIGILGIFGYNLFLYFGMERMDGGTAFIINYLWPLATVVFACILLKEKFTLRKLLAILLSFAGVFAVTTGGGTGKDQLVGAFFCICAALVYGLFSVLNKKKNYNNYISMMLYYFVSFLVSAVYLLLKGSPITLDLPQTLALLWNGVFTYAIAYTFWAEALAGGDTAKISNLAYATPFISLIWTTLILKEPFNPFSLPGLLLIVGGILIQNIQFKKTTNN